ncbi:MAG: ATP synthase F0 subunit B [Planctomycetales bacterium]|nr:ATP synthase F0 subunit B [Planctomycetales bacterium]
MSSKRLAWMFVGAAALTWCVAGAGACAFGQASTDDHATAADAEVGDEAELDAHAEPDAHAAGGHDAHHELGHGNATAKLTHADDFRSDLAIYTLAVFLLLLGILSSAAWPKISAALLERERRIEAAIADAEAKQEAAKRLLVEHEAQMATAADKVREMLEEARRDAEGTKEQIVAEARAVAEKERQRAVRDVELAADQAMKNIAETGASLAVDLAGRVVGEHVQLNPQKQADLIRSALAQLAAATPSKN